MSITSPGYDAVMGEAIDAGAYWKDSQRNKNVITFRNEPKSANL